MAHVSPSATAVPSVPAASVTQQHHRQQAKVVGNYVASFSRAKATGFGVLLIIAGIISITGGSMAIGYLAQCYYVGIGIWSGTIFLSAGSVAIAAGKLKNLHLIRAAAGTAGIAIFCSVSQFSVTTYALVFDVTDCNDYHNYHDNNDGYYNGYYNGYYYRNYNYCGTFIAADCIVIVGALIGFIFATALAAISDKALKSIPKIQPRIVRPVPHVIPAPHPGPVHNVNPALYPVQSGFSLQYVAPVGTGGTLQLVAPLGTGMPMQLQYVMQPQSLPADPNHRLQDQPVISIHQPQSQPADQAHVHQSSLNS